MRSQCCTHMMERYGRDRDPSVPANSAVTASGPHVMTHRLPFRVALWGAGAAMRGTAGPPFKGAAGPAPVVIMQLCKISALIKYVLPAHKYRNVP